VLGPCFFLSSVIEFERVFSCIDNLVCDVKKEFLERRDFRKDSSLESL